MKAASASDRAKRGPEQAVRRLSECPPLHGAPDRRADDVLYRSPMLTSRVMELDVRQWLAQHGFGQYAEAFESQQIDAEALAGLTDDHLKELGIPLGPRIKLLAAIEKLSDRPANVSAPERRQLTVMFVDLVGSTALSTRLDPEDLREVMRQYLDAVAMEIARYEGYIARYQGDGVMAYFGYPKAHEDDAERAVHAALAIVRAVGTLRPEGGAPLSARVGIATGLVIVGDL